MLNISLVLIVILRSPIKRHFTKILFINDGMEFIDLHSIFNDKSVYLFSSVPYCFNNSPIICYEYNRPIRSAKFNFNKIVIDMNKDSNTLDS